MSAFMLNIREHLGPRTIAENVKPGYLVITVDRGIHEVADIELFGSGATDVRITTKGRLPRTLYSRQVYSFMPVKD